jgi:hypothetical protein
MNGYPDYPDYGAAVSLSGMAGQNLAQWQGTPTFREQMQRRLEDARKEVKRVEELLQLLDRNPDVQRIMELMRP